MGSTKVELVADLRAKPPSKQRDRIIERALRGVYHDYDSELATPKIALVTALTDAGFRDLAAKAKDGAYDDEEPNVEQIEEMRQELGPAFFDEVMYGKQRAKQ